LYILFSIVFIWCNPVAIIHRKEGFLTHFKNLNILHSFKSTTPTSWTR